MKEIKNKDIIAGLIVIIILGLIAIVLLIRREIGLYKNFSTKQSAFVEEVQEEIVEEMQKPEEEAELEETTEVSEPEISMQQEQKAEAETSQESTGSETIQTVTEKPRTVIADKKKQNKEIYSILGNEKYTAATLTERKKDNGQLKELYEYWENYKLNAVGDLIRLERFLEMSNELKGSKKFYYYGSVDALGRPDGTGLAVYEDNTYYYGDWKDGMRHGKGMWLEIAVYNDQNREQNLGLIEHSYNGSWSKDLPNGEGQEHFYYDFDILQEESLQEDKMISNVIGRFKDGYYDGEMYLMTADSQGNTFDWSGTCKNGVWEIIMEGNTTDAVWQSYESNEQGEVTYHFIYPEHNKNWGIIGLKK